MWQAGYAYSYNLIFHISIPARRGVDFINGMCGWKTLETPEVAAVNDGLS